MNAALHTARSPLRVLVVDDDPVYRLVLRKAMRNLDKVEVVDTASNGADAQRRISKGDVDAVTIDVVLQGESGLDLLAWVRREQPEVAPILVTGGTSSTASTEVDALVLGAAALILKPSGPGAAQELASQLERTFAGLQTRAQRPIPTGPVLSTKAFLRKLPPRRGQRELIAIGASTGGPPVVLKLLQELRAGTQTPIVLAQHMLEQHLGYMIDHMRRKIGGTVVSPEEGQAIEPGGIYVAGRGDAHLTVARSAAGGLVCRWSATPPEHNCRPAVDPLFRSVAAACGGCCVGVVATGMGCDGAIGAKHLKDAGASVVVQDEESSVVWGMPKAVVAAGAADAVVPGDRLAKSVLSWIEGY